jgi:hypothetical protein
MSKLKAIFLVCVSACIAGCFDSCCEDCEYSEDKLSAYVNKSGEAVKIVVINPYYEEVIVTGDTLLIANEDSFYNYSVEEYHIFLPISCDFQYCFDKPIKVELHFLDSLEKCLIFDGPIKNDGIDMRSWDSYKRGNEIPDWVVGSWRIGMEYVYTITPEHRDMATEEDCESSAGE